MRATVESDVKGLSIGEGWETAPRGAHARDGPEVLAGMAATSVWGLMALGKSGRRFSAS